MNPLFSDWLHRLDTAAAGLPDERRRDLITDLTEHLAAADASGLDDAGAREVVDRLGSPEQVVAAAWQEVPGQPSSHPSAGVAGPSGGAMTATATANGHAEWWAIGLLLGGAVLAWAHPLLGLLGLAGAVVACLAPGWSRREKWVSTLIAVGLPVLAVVVAALVLPRLGGQDCSDAYCSDLDLSGSQHGFGLGGMEVLFILVMAPIVTTICWLLDALYLGLRLRRR